MPEETSPEIETPVEDQTPQHPPEEQVEGEQPVEEEESGDGREAYQQMWEEIAPELASELNELSPEARERFLLKRLAATQAATSTTEDVSSQDTSTDNGTKTARPPVVEIPALDQEEIRTVVTAAIEDGEAEAMVNVLVKQFQYVQGMASLVNSTLSEQDDKISQFAKPARLRAEIKNVKGATDEDVTAAQKLLDSGDAGTPLAALKLAVLDRRTNASGREPSVSRRAAGQRASLASVTGRREGTPAIRIPISPEEEKEAMRREEEAQRKKK